VRSSSDEGLPDDVERGEGGIHEEQASLVLCLIKYVSAIMELQGHPDDDDWQDHTRSGRVDVGRILGCMRKGTLEAREAALRYGRGQNCREIN